MSKKIAIIGAGPAGLFSAYLLLKAGFEVALYDQSSGVAKKFLIAGNGGLNLTHSEDLDRFAKRYGKDEVLFRRLLHAFSPEDLRSWCQEIGIETFVGSSGRVFPKEMKAGKVVVNWLNSLKEYDQFSLHLKHRLKELKSGRHLILEGTEGDVEVKADFIILALGGASWKKTGSDGEWKALLDGQDIEVKEFKAMNCGFEREWSSFFIQSVDRAPFKHVEISLHSHKAKGDLMITPYGVEGGVIYALSHLIRDEIEKHSKTTIYIDLFPNLSREEILEKIENKPKKTSLSNYLRKALRLNKSGFILLKELLEPETFQNMDLLSKALKEIPLPLTGVRPLDEAISTSGGVGFNEVDDQFQVKKLPGLYAIGEMLDYEAPTGGYLLQGCFSSAYVACQSIINS